MTEPRFSFKYWGQQTSWVDLEAVWRNADSGGFWDAAWLNDHLYPPRADRELPIFDAYALLAGCAAITNRLRFGVMVTANTFRHPAVLAKMAVTIDHMSNGRLELGVGAGWLESEHEAFGIPLPPLTERFDRLDETFTIIDGLLTNDTFSLDGPFHTIVGAEFMPKSIQKPRIPFVVGGAGPKRTLPLAAKWADQWNYPDFGASDALDVFSDRLALLRSLCAEIGRDPREIEISAQIRYPGDIAAAIDRITAYREAGATHMLVSFMPPTDLGLPAEVGDALGNHFGDSG
ncbi:MAG: LLM class flavin-dependent oxidoreductase [Acidimicrobiales bacterium]